MSVFLCGIIFIFFFLFKLKLITIDLLIFPFNIFSFTFSFHLFDTGWLSFLLSIFVDFFLMPLNVQQQHDNKYDTVYMLGQT